MNNHMNYERLLNQKENSYAKNELARLLIADVQVQVTENSQRQPKAVPNLTVVKSPIESQFAIVTD